MKPLCKGKQTVLAKAYEKIMKYAGVLDDDE